MAFDPQKIDYSQINNGNEYQENDMLSPEDINKWFRSGAFTQKFVDVFGNNIDTTEIDGEGTPQVLLVDKVVEGVTYKILKLINFKGKTGDSGISNALLSNEIGNSDLNGYTQKATNSLIVKKNLLYNPTFSINQRGETSYTSSSSAGFKYLCDRWQLYTNKTGVTFTHNADNSVTINNSATSTADFEQVIPKEYSNDIRGNYVTISAIINGETVTGTVQIPTSPTPSNLIRVEKQGYVMRFYEATTMGCFVFGVQVNSSSTITISKAKVEIGIAPTTIETPDYSTELQRCQYFYQKLTVMSTQLVTGMPVFKIPLARSIRDSYTLVAKTTPLVWDENGNKNADFSAVGKDAGSIIVVASLEVGDFVYGKPYLFTTELEVEAEL